MRHFDIPTSKTGKATWNHLEKQIREGSLAPATIKAYKRSFDKAEWPLDSPFRIMAYLDQAPPSDSSLRQWMATATRIHKCRLWPVPNFKHPLVQSFIEALKRREVPTRSLKEKPVIFNENELRTLFKCLQRGKEPTDLRNWAIAVVQLFGVRRASEVLALKAKDVYWEDDTFLIRIPYSKTDKRKQGIFFKLPRTSTFGFNPSEVLAKHILATKGNGQTIFQSYDSNAKRFKQEPISLNGWNRALKRICLRAKILPRTSHAFRRSAITLSPIELVEAVAQTGGWRSLCFWEVYRRFDIDQRAQAVSQIGTRAQVGVKQHAVISI